MINIIDQTGISTAAVIENSSAPPQQQTSL